MLAVVACIRLLFFYHRVFGVSGTWTKRICVIIYYYGTFFCVCIYSSLFNFRELVFQSKLIHSVRVRTIVFIIIFIFQNCGAIHRIMVRFRFLYFLFSLMSLGDFFLLLHCLSVSLPHKIVVLDLRLLRFSYTFCIG